MKKLHVFILFSLSLGLSDPPDWTVNPPDFQFNASMTGVLLFNGEESTDSNDIIAAFVGALVGFLWYNTYPAQIFMGDTGSLTIGGIIAVISVAVRKEWLIPLICGIFLIENLSVIIQVFYFKYTKKKYGEGRRIFKMSPLHHHYQMSGYHESKIVTRFWILGIFLAILSIVTLKIR